ncbi:hypothetical protein [Acinetobacter sp. P1(2025)]|uniref:hypothetical protein n=1 Tax=Acinetobacter sp. P1(2025) TaxID=3446120 RepID=UPI003F53BD21
MVLTPQQRKQREASNRENLGFSRRSFWIKDALIQDIDDTKSSLNLDSKDQAVNQLLEVAHIVQHGKPHKPIFVEDDAKTAIRQLIFTQFNLSFPTSIVLAENQIQNSVATTVSDWAILNALDHLKKVFVLCRTNLDLPQIAKKYNKKLLTLNSHNLAEFNVDMLKADVIHLDLNDPDLEQNHLACLATMFGNELAFHVIESESIASCATFLEENYACSLNMQSTVHNSLYLNSNKKHFIHIVREFDDPQSIDQIFEA